MGHLVVHHVCVLVPNDGWFVHAGDVTSVDAAARDEALARASVCVRAPVRAFRALDRRSVEFSRNETTTTTSTSQPRTA